MTRRNNTVQARCVGILWLVMVLACLGGERVIYQEDFEGEVALEATTSPYNEPTGTRIVAPPSQVDAHVSATDPEGKAGVTVERVGDRRVLRLQNSPTVGQDFLPAMSWWLHGDDVVRSGTLVIAFDLLIAAGDGARVDLMVRDWVQAPRGRWQEHLSLKYKHGKLHFGQKTLAVERDSWMTCRMELPLKDSDTPGSLTITTAAGEVRLEVPLAKPALGVVWIGITSPGKTDSHVLLDNFSIVANDEQPAPPAAESAVPVASMAWKATPPMVLDVFPATSVNLPPERQGETVMSATYTPSGSTWGAGIDERWVFHQEMVHRQDEANSYALRLGKGGQIYSLRGAFGESIPPSSAGSPWNDEVWQFVAVCTAYNGSLQRGGPVPDGLDKMPYKQTYFIHNSGAYMRGQSAIKNLYCPLLGADSPNDRTYRSVNWGLVPQTKTVHRSPLLYYVQTRDVGDGIIELTWVVHNFSVREDIVFDWLNAPWGGTRLSNLPHHSLKMADGALIDRIEVRERKIDRGIDVRKTGGWNLSSAGEADDSPSLALVFGRDKHLDAELAKTGDDQLQYNHSIYRDWLATGSDWLATGSAFREQDWRTRPGNSYRNYEVAVVIPRFYLRPGTSVWYRSYLVVNRRDRAIELADMLVDKVDYGYASFALGTTPMVPVVVGDQRFSLYAKPVPGSKPLFLIEHAETGQQVVTSDPYIFVAQEPVDFGLPDENTQYSYYNNATGYDLSRHNSRWQRLLGYGMVARPANGHWQRLSEIAPESFPAATENHLDLWLCGDERGND